MKLNEKNELILQVAELLRLTSNHKPYRTSREETCRCDFWNTCFHRSKTGKEKSTPKNVKKS